MAISPNATWELVADEKTFARHRDDERLHRILTLARISNSIRFIQVSVINPGGTDTPEAVRQRMSSFLYLTGVLHEGFQFADRLGALFRNHDVFRNGLARVLSDPSVKLLRTKYLDTLRNTSVYHHDDSVIVGALAEMNADEYVFASGAGTKRGDVYYDLADIAVLHSAIGGPTSPAEFVARLTPLLSEVTQAAIRFADAADQLIAHVVRDLGWQMREVSL